MKLLQYAFNSNFVPNRFNFPRRRESNMDLGQHCGPLKEITCSPAETLTWTQSSHVNLVYHGNAISKPIFLSAKRNVGLREYHPTQTCSSFLKQQSVKGRRVHLSLPPLVLVLPVIWPSGSSTSSSTRSSTSSPSTNPYTARLEHEL